MNNMPQAIALLVCALATVAAGGAELSLSDFEAPGQWSGLELSSEQVKQGSRSGNWSHMDQTPTIRLASCPRDWSDFAGIDLWIYNPRLLRAPLYLTIASENPKTKAADAYSHRIDLSTWTGWRHLTVPFTGMDLIGAPQGWNQIDGVRVDAFDWVAKPNPVAIVYLDDVKLVTRDQIRGPRLTDEDFFAALDLTRPGLEQVAAAVAAGDHTRAKAELLAYYRARPNPTGRGERRAGPRNERPSLAALTSWNGFAHSLTVNWTGWKRFRLTKRDFQTVHRPRGWNFIRYAFVLMIATPRPAGTWTPVWSQDGNERWVSETSVSAASSFQEHACSRFAFEAPQPTALATFPR